MPESIEHPDRLVIYPSRLKATLVLLGAAVFVGLGIWIATPGMARRVAPWEVLLASYVGVPFFAACGLYAAYRIVIRRPAVEIDSTGITDSSSPFGAGHLNWDEVDRVVLYRYQRQPMLGIFPKDLSTFLDRQGAVRRSFVRLNLALGTAPVNLSQVTHDRRGACRLDAHTVWSPRRGYDLAASEVSCSHPARPAEVKAKWNARNMLRTNRNIPPVQTT